jgi:hypothetical protein
VSPLSTYYSSNPDDNNITTSPQAKESEDPEDLQDPPSLTVSTPKTPSTLVSVTTIGNAKQPKALVGLLDSGGSHCMIHRRAIPKGAIETIEQGCSFASTAGNFKINSSINIAKLALPEFSHALHLRNIKAYVYDAPSEYDIILGRTLLKDAGIMLNFSNEQIEWLEHTIDMKPPNYWSKANIHATLSVDPKVTHDLSAYTTTAIKDAEYEQANLEDLILQQRHLSVDQQNDLYRTFLQCHKLFSGKLGVYPHKVFHIDLKPDAVPYHSKAYQVPRVHLPTFKKELNRLVSTNVLRRAGATKWAAGTFIIPKKDNTVCWVTDFRKLNQYIDRKQYPLPKIKDVVQQQRPYKFITKLDISMEYYTFQLDKESQELCTIITPFGKYHYNVLPMGVCQSPDWAQATIEEVLHDLIDKYDLTVYIDDIKITNNSWQEHLQAISDVLKRLQDNAFTVNPLKCEWAVQETDFLGFWFTPTGVKPWAKKVQGILNLAPPQNRTEVRAFCGAVTFY